MIGLGKKTVEDIDVKGKTCLVRCDFNVPLKDSVIGDDKRIVESLKTIKYLKDNGAKLVLCSHLGRPKGEVKPEFSLVPVQKRLEELLNCPVIMAKDVVGEDAKEKAKNLKEGEILLLENLRYHKEEEKNDETFSKELASLAQIYVNDAFGTAHRAHASTAGVAAFLPSVCGYLIQKEIDVMGKALQDPKRPFVAILGGAKVGDKIGVINNLITKVDSLIIGGGMAYTFFKAMGYNIGTSLCEEDKVELAKTLIQKAKDMNVDLLLPTDTVIGDEFKADCNFKTVNSNEIPDGWMGLDIGEKASADYDKVIKEAGTVVWNGPMGVFEMPEFAKGTKAVAKSIADSDAISIIGGGDSAAAVEQLGFSEYMTHISTGGGASLEFLEGLPLPGIVALNDK